MPTKKSASRWRTFALAGVAGAAIAGCGGQQTGSGQATGDAAAPAAEPPMLGITWTRDEHAFRVWQEMLSPDFSSARATANMTYHGGKIMTSAKVYPIFWGTSWPSYSGDKMTGIDAFYAGWNNSRYAGTSTEYTGTNGRVGAGSTSAVHVIDGSAASGGATTTPILNEVCKAIASGLVPNDTSGNGYYPVYTDLPRGTAGFCAWHSAGTCNGNLVQFAFFFKLDGDAGCDPADTTTGHSQGLAAIANVTAHELAEALTDPASPGAWYDSRGAENGDKCAWTFNVPSVTFSNGTQWKVQGEWSNAAYTAGTGYPNSSGQRGCLDGH
jgi:hypothetical protein